MNGHQNEQFDFLLNRLEHDVPTRTLSYAEGELAVLFKDSTYSHREVYTPEMKRELLQALMFTKEPGVYLTSILDTDAESAVRELTVPFRQMLSALDLPYLSEFHDAKMWYGVLHELAHQNEQTHERVHALLEVFRTRSVTVVGGAHLAVLHRHIGRFEHIETPTFGATCWYTRIIDDLCRAKPTQLYLLSCGIAANAVIHRVAPRYPQASFIDLGSFWDMALGIGTRKEPMFDRPLIVNI